MDTSLGQHGVVLYFHKTGSCWWGWTFSGHFQTLPVSQDILSTFHNKWSPELIDSSDFFVFFVATSSCFLCGMAFNQEQHQKWPGNETGQAEVSKATPSLARSWLHTDFQNFQLLTGKINMQACYYWMACLCHYCEKWHPRSVPSNSPKWFPPFVNWKHCLFYFSTLCVLFCFCLFFALLSPLPSTPNRKMRLLNNQLSRGNLLPKYFWSIINFNKK